MSEITTAELDELVSWLAEHPDMEVPLVERGTVEKLIAAARESTKLAERAEELPANKSEVRWCPECDALTREPECACMRDSEGGVPTITITELEEEFAELSSECADAGDTIRALTARAEAAEARVRELESQLARTRPLRAPGWDMRTCESCGEQTRITTAGCDHCDLEDK